MQGLYFGRVSRRHRDHDGRIDVPLRDLPDCDNDGRTVIWLVFHVNPKEYNDTLDDIDNFADSSESICDISFHKSKYRYEGILFVEASNGDFRLNNVLGQVRVMYPGDWEEPPFRYMPLSAHSSPPSRP